MYSVCDTFRWVSPFRNLRIKAYLPAPRSLSQAITSFVAYHCQGIHHMLLFTWPYNFDVCYNTKVYFQGMFWLVFHQSRYAVNFTELSLILFTWKFKLIWIFMWRNQKIVVNGTVCTYLYELVQFPLTTLIRLYEFLKNSRVHWTISVNIKEPSSEDSLILIWWRMTGSNRRPPACKAGALPAELIPHFLSLPV